MTTVHSSLLLYLRTVSYLKKEQLLYRTWYALRRRAQLFRFSGAGVARSPLSSSGSSSARPSILRPSLTGSCNAEDRTETRSWKPLKTAVPFLASFGCDASDIVQGRFRFLNNAVDFGRNPDWAAKSKDRLWRYNLHYFSYLMTDGGLPEQAARHLIESWIAENPPGAEDAWDPFPTSLRLVNWIKYLSSTSSIADWADQAALSARAQVLWLENYLEYHLMGNHLLKNAKALIFAGLFFCGGHADRWFAKGIRILRKELDEQVLSDGGHFERSPMYHSMIFEDCLDLLNVLLGISGASGVPAPACLDLNEMTVHLENLTAKMAAFLEGMIHPDRQIPLFNDAALGIEHDPDKLLSYWDTLTGRKRQNPGLKLLAFPESGYFVMAPRPEDRLIVDCGPIGPDYQSGHAHCDLLSFELSLMGRRVIVDSGCALYEEGEIRRYNRGNLGHNAVTVDGCDQSEVWGAHRCGGRARPIYARLRELDDGSILFEGAHDGYGKLPGNPTHHRSIRWTGNEIQIRDYVDGNGAHRIESRIHINPDLSVLPKDGSVLVSDGANGLVEFFVGRGGKIESTQGWYCPEFGIQKKCTVLRVLENHAKLPYSLCWRLKIVDDHLAT